MPWLEQTPNGIYHIAFRYGGREYHKPTALNELNILIDTAQASIPGDADLGTFSLSDGQLNRAPSSRSKRRLRTLRKFSDAFLASIPAGALEASTVSGMETHIRHLQRVLGASFLLLEVQLEDLQRYVDRRSKDKGVHGKGLSPATIKQKLRRFEPCGMLA